MSDFIKDFGRYIVAKTKHLTPEQCQQLRDLIGSFDHPPLECVCIESDWPNYSDTWKAVEQITNGEYQSPYNLIEQQQREIEEWKKAANKHKQIDMGNREFIEMQKKTVGELTEERDALAAHVERLKESLIYHAGVMDDLNDQTHPNIECDAVAHEMREDANKSPTTSLNAVKHKVAESAYKQGSLDTLESLGTTQKESRVLCNYMAGNYAAKKYPIDGEG